jgi:predicted AlkP superfamily phosphohydrolase/phosphomutase
MARPSRVCVIGVDAADPALVDRWCAEGALPTLDRLRRTATYVALDDATQFPSASVWPTLYSGTHPGHHGFVHPVAMRPGTTTLGTVVPDDASPVWSRLSSAGARSIVVDVPFAPLLDGLDGLQVLDWAAYERYSPPRSRPAALLAETVRRAGPYPVQRDLSRDPALGERELRRDHAQLLAGVAVKGAALRWMASHHPWDFFMAAFTEAHAVGHHFWHLEDGRGPGHADGATHPIRDVYRAIDAELARFIDALDLTTTMLIVLSGHGMGRNASGWHLVDPLLRRLGLLAGAATRDRAALLRQLRTLCPAAMRRWVSRRLPHAVRTSVSGYWLASGIDRRRTRAFAVPSDQLGFVRVNVAGREPGGIVQGRAEYDEVCATIADALASLVDGTDGRPAVRAVFRTDETFPGPARDRLPDLLVCWNDDAALGAVREKDGTTIAAPSPDPRSGNHRPYGFAMIAGAGAGAGRPARGHLLDFAPTVLGAFGLERAPSMPGRSWLEPWPRERGDGRESGSTASSLAGAKA